MPIGSDDDASVFEATNDWRNITLPMPAGSSWAGSIRLNVTNRSTTATTVPRTLLVQAPRNAVLNIPYHDYTASPYMACYFGQRIVANSSVIESPATGFGSSALDESNVPVASGVASFAVSGISTFTDADVDAIRALASVPTLGCVIGSVNTKATAAHSGNVTFGSVFGTPPPSAALPPLHLLTHGSNAVFAPSYVATGPHDAYVAAADIPTIELDSTQFQSTAGRCETNAAWGGPFIVSAAPPPALLLGAQRGTITAKQFGTTGPLCSIAYRDARFNVSAMVEICTADPGCFAIVPPVESAVAGVPIAGFADHQAAGSVAANAERRVVSPWPAMRADVVIVSSGAIYNSTAAAVNLADRLTAWAVAYTELQAADASTTASPDSIQFVELNFETRKRVSKAAERDSTAGLVLSSVSIAMVLVLAIIVAVTLVLRRRKGLNNGARSFMSRMNTRLL